jgi:hypothetical protein
MYNRNILTALLGVSLMIGSTCLAADSPILGTVNLIPIVGNLGEGRSEGLAYNPTANVFYISTIPAGPGGSIYTIDPSGKLLNTLDAETLFGSGYSVGSMAYDQGVSGHIFLLTDHRALEGNFVQNVVEMSTDGSTTFQNFQLDNTTCSVHSIAVTTDNLWISCLSQNKIRKYSRTGNLISEIPVGDLFLQAGAGAIAPDFGDISGGHFAGGLFIVDLNGQRLLDITIAGSLLAAASTVTLGQPVYAMATDLTTHRIFLSVNSSTIYILSPQFLLPPAVSLSNSNWTFSAHAPGTESGIGQIFVTNAGQASLEIAGAQLAGDSPDQFTLANNCPTTLGIAHTCNLQFTFKPTKTGPMHAKIQLTDDALDTPQIISINGVGSGPALQLSHYAWHFMSHVVGQSSGSATLFATNVGTSTLHFTSISMQGTNARDFPITGTTCGSTLAPNKTCGVTFHFTPSALGTRTGALTFQDDAIPAQQVMTLSGLAEPSQ